MLSSSSIFQRALASPSAASRIRPRCAAFSASRSTSFLAFANRPTTSRSRITRRPNELLDHFDRIRPFCYHHHHHLHQFRLYAAARRPLRREDYYDLGDHFRRQQRAAAANQGGNNDISNSNDSNAESNTKNNPQQPQPSQPQQQQQQQQQQASQDPDHTVKLSREEFLASQETQQPETADRLPPPMMMMMHNYENDDYASAIQNYQAHDDEDTDYDVLFAAEQRQQQRPAQPQAPPQQQQPQAPQRFAAPGRQVSPSSAFGTTTTTANTDNNNAGGSAFMRHFSSQTEAAQQKFDQEQQEAMDNSDHRNEDNDNSNDNENDSNPTTIPEAQSAAQMLADWKEEEEQQDESESNANELPTTSETTSDTFTTNDNLDDDNKEDEPIQTNTGSIWDAVAATVPPPREPRYQRVIYTEEEDEEDEGYDDYDGDDEYAASDDAWSRGGDESRMPKSSFDASPSSTTLATRNTAIAIDDWVDGMPLEEYGGGLQQQPPRSADVGQQASMKPPPPPPTPFETDSLISTGVSPEPATSSQQQKQKPKQEKQNLFDLSIEELEEEMNRITDAAYQQNKGKEFKLNSPKQVALAVFGDASQSTAKDVLEAIEHCNRMAKLVLEYRQAKSMLQRKKKNQDLADKGTLAKSATKVVRTKKAAEDAAPTRPAEKVASAMTSTNSTNNDEIETDALLLVDASALIFRAYHGGIPMHRSDGTPTGALHVVCTTLNKLILYPLLAEGLFDADGNPVKMPRVVLVFDSKGKKTFRHELFPAYKANRPELPIDLAPQFDLVRQAASALGMVQMEAPGYEADDVIATLAHWASNGNNRTKEGMMMDTNILSGDKDLWQLVTEDGQVPSVHMIDPKTSERITYHQVMEKWQVPPSKLGDALALAGDAADNIPGVPRIGPKIAAQLIKDYGSLEGVLENAAEQPPKRRQMLEENADMARLSRELVELRRDVPLRDFVIRIPSDGALQPKGDEIKVSDYAQLMELLRMKPIDKDRILNFYQENSFQTLQRTFRKNWGEAPAKPKKRKSTVSEKVTIPKPEDYADVPF